MFSEEVAFAQDLTDERTSLGRPGGQGQQHVHVGGRKASVAGKQCKVGAKDGAQVQ